MTPRSTAQFIPWWSLIHLYIYLGLCFEFLEDSVKNFKTPNISTFDLCHVAGLQAERLLMCALKLVETLIDHLWVHTSQSVNQTQAVSTVLPQLIWGHGSLNSSMNFLSCCCFWILLLLSLSQKWFCSLIIKKSPETSDMKSFYCFYQFWQFVGDHYFNILQISVLKSF